MKEFDDINIGISDAVMSLPTGILISVLALLTREITENLPQTSQSLFLFQLVVFVLGITPLIATLEGLEKMLARGFFYIFGIFVGGLLIGYYTIVFLAFIATGLIILLKYIDLERKTSIV